MSLPRRGRNLSVNGWLLLHSNTRRSDINHPLQQRIASRPRIWQRRLAARSEPPCCRHRARGHRPRNAARFAHPFCDLWGITGVGKRTATRGAAFCLIRICPHCTLMDHGGARRSGQYRGLAGCFASCPTGATTLLRTEVDAKRIRACGRFSSKVQVYGGKFVAVPRNHDESDTRRDREARCAHADQRSPGQEASLWVVGVIRIVIGFDGDGALEGVPG